MSAENQIPTLYDFADFEGYLRHVRAHFPKRRRSLTYEKLAELLGYQSPRLISMVEKGHRSPSSDFVGRLNRVLGLKDSERRYLESLGEKSRQRLKNRPLDEIENRLTELRQIAAQPKTVEGPRFRVIAEWQHLPMYMLATSADAPETPAGYARRLRGKITIDEAAETLKRLEETGFIQKKENGRYGEADPGAKKTEADVPSAAVQRHHQGMIDRARESLTEVMTHRRDVNSHCLRMDPARLVEAKAEIDRFVNEFNNKFSVLDGQDVFQLNVQLFPHT